MNTLFRDVRHAVRSLRRDLGFTAAIVLTLAIGVGVDTAVFGIVRSILLQPLPYGDPDRLVVLWTTIVEQGIHESPSAYANVRDWKAQNRVLEDLATYDPTTLTLTGGDWPEQLSAAQVSANLFAVLGAAPALGRGFSPEDEQQQVPVVVLSHGLWQHRFGGSADAIGHTIGIGGAAYQVIGVMPEGFGFPDRGTELWLPQTLLTDWEAAAARRGTDAWRVVGRLRAGVSLEQARREMNLIGRRLETLHPGANAGLGIRVVPLHEQVTGYSFRLALWTLFGAVGLVLLIACANVAHLFLVRRMKRAQELAVRVALGATTRRLIRQGLTESMVLSLAAAGVGLLLAVAGLRLFVALAPGNIPRLEEVGIDPAVLVYGVIVSAAAGVLFGIAPALSWSQGAPFDVLREGRVSPRTPAHRARGLLIACQFALAIILVFGASLLMRSLMEAHSVDPGIRTDDVLMANLSVESQARRVDFYQDVAQSVQAIPGVRSAGIVEDLLISGAPNRPITIEGRGAAEPSFAELRIDAVAGAFFETIGLPLRAGRVFSRGDGAQAPPVAIINETMARRFWPGEVPVGRRFRIGGPQTDDPWIEVVGVVADMRRQGPETEPIPQVFRPYVQEPSRNMVLVVHTDGAVSGLAAAVRTTVARIDDAVPLYRVTTVARALDRYLLQRRFHAILLGVFSAVALALAAVGIYGLLQYSVAQRTREIALRIALGAGSAQVVSMILRQGLAVAVPGLAAGILCALWLSDAISGLLFGVAPSDVINVVVTSGLLLLTAIAACYIPARRAAGVDPMTALRYR